ncbi:MAG: hypothetical protein NC123_09435 [Butyrivibrio sp.]|nr:hypothetical protein [Acetatifactor muris]MCM1559757.1 hypothetical protein [Butyrivibrio sp.]
MALLGNILWFIFFGWWNFLLYGLLGIIFSITIIGIPIGKALFQYAKLMALPFGKVIIKETELKGKENVSVIRRVGGMIANILWLPIGIITFILNIGTMIVCAISIIGIPVAVVIARSCKFLLWPVGAKVITKDKADTLKMERAMTKVMQTNAAAGNTAVYSQAASAQGIQLQQAPPQTVMPQTISVNPAPDLQQNPQSGQRLENIKETGGKAVSAIAETGGKAVSAIAETGGKAVSAIAATGSAGVSALSNRQKMIKEKILARQTDVTTDDLLMQAEAKLYRNSAMAWIMPFLEYITLIIGVLSGILGLIQMRSFQGLFQGFIAAAPLMILAALLGMIKRNRIFTIAVLGVQLVSHISIILISLLRTATGFGIDIKGVIFGNVLWIVCYIGSIVVYVYTSIVKSGTGQKQAASSNIQPISEEVPFKVKKFCSRCGKETPEGIAFCGNCGAKIE